MPKNYLFLILVPIFMLAFWIINHNANSPLITLCDKYTDENFYIPKGGTGMVMKDLSIEIEDEQNIIYHKWRPFYQGLSSNRVEALQIIIQDDHSVSITPLNIHDPLQESGLIVVFSNQKIYILDFDNKQYGFYVRNTDHSIFFILKEKIWDLLNWITP